MVITPVYCTNNNLTFAYYRMLSHILDVQNIQNIVESIVENIFTKSCVIKYRLIGYEKCTIIRKLGASGPWTGTNCRGTMYGLPCMW